ncbi:ATPase [Marinitoga hydrogenitolerans DSM 16785]|uniref:ATPase n=1 Tax=Marinitoga hydrogenitolerans (strain DSM 16785 / JCM 12826 / AT1271) TaxID=1122195 RepID=A0A1M4YKC7_MARH1|nr:AAA family ATPase [Marinitoga hydrogenitolerans]SHF05952.1 ATPase [Marinitoga hydrogenitolerans DSM 16785]
MELGKIIERLIDKPLDEKNKNLLVNRDKEFELINLIINYQPYGIYGICGETGIGKTTVINNIHTDFYTIKISLSQRESQDTILYDILYNISVKTEKDIEISSEIKEWILEEISYIKGFAIGINFFGNGDISNQKHKIPRFNYFKAKEYLNKLTDELIKKYKKVVLIIDELDKESKKEVLLVLDNLKLELQKEGFVVMVSLPYSIYREYKFDRMHRNESGNLENVIKDIIYLREFTNSEIKEILIKRIKEFIYYFDESVIDLIVDYSDGNPRDAFWITQKLIFEALSKKLSKIDKMFAEETIKNIVNEYLNEISLTEKQKLMIDEDLFPGKREEILKKAIENKKFPRSTAYSIFDKLLKTGIIIEQNGIYRLSGKSKYLYIN